MFPNACGRPGWVRGLDCRAGWIRFGIEQERVPAWSWVSVCGSRLTGLRRDWAVAIWPPVAKELPHFADFRDHIEIEIRDHHFVFIAAGLRDNFAARIAEV